MPRIHACRVPVLISLPSGSAHPTPERGVIDPFHEYDFARAQLEREIRLSFSAGSLDSIARAHAFRKAGDGWVLENGDQEAPTPALTRGALSVFSASQMLRTYSDAGSAEEQGTSTLAVLRHADGCAIVLAFDEIESRGAELRAGDTFMTLADR